MALLDRSKLLAKQKLKIERVDLGGGDEIYVREMTGREKDVFERSLMTEVRDKNEKLLHYDRNLADFKAKLAVCTICDADGKLILEPGDFEILSQNISASRLEKIIDVAQSLNTITDEDKDTMLKNSEGAQSASSTSDSVES